MGIGIIIASHGKFMKIRNQFYDFGEQKVQVVTFMQIRVLTTCTLTLRCIAQFVERWLTKFLSLQTFGLGHHYRQAVSRKKIPDHRWLSWQDSTCQCIQAYTERMKLLMLGLKRLSFNIYKRKQRKALRTRGPYSKEDTKPADAKPSFLKVPFLKEPFLVMEKIKYVLARVDTRLLHGRVATGWTHSTHQTIVIVVSRHCLSW